MTDLCYLPARQMVSLTTSGELSAVELLQAHLDRIEQVNPEVNAIVSADPEMALADAQAADRRWVSGRPLGRLHGLPMAFKDTHDAAGLPTTFGSTVRADNRPQRDELIIARLRGAGVVRTGKTNVPEFAAGSHTFNRLFGTTRNPYDLGRSAGGSSGGAAASLAAGMQALADGSDMGGSLRNPASFCNVVGLRPTPGRVPTYPAQLPEQILSVQGPMARSVDDLALMLSVIAGPDPRAPISIAEDAAAMGDFDTRKVAGLRVGWSPDLGEDLPVESVVLEPITTQLRRLADLGCVLSEVEPPFSGADFVFRTLRARQFYATLGPLLRQHPGELKSTLASNIREGESVTRHQLSEAQRIQGELAQRFADFFETYDLLILPVSQVAPFPAGLEYPQEIMGIQMESYLDWMRSCYLVSAVGVPALSVPAGFTSTGLPIGMQLVAAHRNERLLLQVGRVLEALCGSSFARPDALAAPRPTDQAASREDGLVEPGFD